MVFRLLVSLSLLSATVSAASLYGFEADERRDVGEVAAVSECQKVRGADCAGSLLIPWWQCTVPCWTGGGGVSWWPQTPDQPLCNGFLQLNPCTCGAWGDTYTFTGCSGG